MIPLAAGSDVKRELVEISDRDRQGAKVAFLAWLADFTLSAAAIAFDSPNKESSSIPPQALAKALVC